MTTDDVRGIAVHIAARIESLAGPGEVFVSSVTRELAEAACVEYRDRGFHDLRGVSGQRQIYSAVWSSRDEPMPAPGGY